MTDYASNTAYGPVVVSVLFLHLFCTNWRHYFECCSLSLSGIT